MEKIEFEERAVAFLDILGFKDFIAKAEQAGTNEHMKFGELIEVINNHVKFDNYELTTPEQLLHFR